MTRERTRKPTPRKAERPPVPPRDVLVSDDAANERYGDAFRVLRASLNCDLGPGTPQDHEETEE